MFEEKTPEEIKRQIAELIETELETREGSFFDDMLGPVAVEFSKIYGSLNAVRPMVWVDETSGSYLDLAAEDLGIPPRKPGVKASAELLITGKPGYQIPAGTAFLSDEGLCFDTLKDAVISSDGTVFVESSAREIGERYNVPEDAITFQFDNNAQIFSVTNPLSAKGGADAETDKGLFSRISKARKKPATSGNVSDYEAWAIETPGVGYVKVLPLWNGNGTVKVLIAGERGQPVDALIQSKCIENIESKRPIGASVTVESVVAFNVSIAVTVRAEPAADRQDIKEHITREISRYFEAIAFSYREVLVNKIGAAIISTEGVVNYSELLLNGEANNILLADNQVPCIMGEVEIQWI